MKRIIILLLFATMMVTLGSYVYAEETNRNGTSVLNGGVAQVLDSQFLQLSEDEKDLLRSSEDFDITNEPILKVYEEVYWNLAGESLSQIVATAETYRKSLGYQDYYVLSDVPHKMRIFHGELSRVDGKEIPSYVKDIYKMSKQVEISGQQSELQAIYCFDGESSHDGIVVYLQTNTGVVVKYYENSRSEPQVFSGEQFQKYAVDYYAYISSYENNYNEKGEALGGNKISFEKYLENPSLYGDMNEGSRVSDFIWIGASLFIAISAVTIGLVVYKRVRRCKDI